MHDAGTTMAATSIATTSRTNAPQVMAPAEKPEKFAGIDFKRWQQKIFFYFTTLCLQRNYILSGFQDDLYNVYEGTKTAKELWEALERKYKTEDAGTKKFFVARFLEYKMIDSKSVISQVYELQMIIHDLLAEGLIVNEAFQVVAIIEKLPPMWKDFKNYLKHKRKEMSVEDLIVRLRIEEDNKAAKRRSRGNFAMNEANIVEDDYESRKRKKARNKSNQPKNKFKRKCFNCGKIDHKLTDCWAPKNRKKKDQANMAESKKETDDLCVMLSECNLVGNPRKWWMNFGATRYVCANKELFSMFAPAQGEEKIFIANSATAKVEGTGKVYLKMTSAKVLTLNNVLSGLPQSLWEEAILTSNQILNRASHIDSEIDSILSNHTWELVDLPPGNKSLGSKWIFKRKIKTDRTIDKYKARLVVKGFKQKKGLDYFDTYSPVTRIMLIRMLIALAAVYDLEIYQMNLKTAFLNGELEEQIYMEQPEGFVVPGKENKRYFDINATKRMLESKFDMKDLGVADVFLGIRIHRTPQGLALSQSYYIEKVLDKFKYMEFGISKTSLDVSFALQKNEGKAGSMMYNGKSHHIRRRNNTVRELLSSEIITVDSVKSKDNVSDSLIKGLSREGVERTYKGMGLRLRTSQHDAEITTVAFAMIVALIWKKRNASRFQQNRMNIDRVLKGGGSAYPYKRQEHRKMATSTRPTKCLSVEVNDAIVIDY
ncbi:putative phosphoserine aminotransferase, chloroplastic-like [Capsicum annuum]|nr:putative phosphoserine aminotransferase, chloroplastic-like [Capsicum annuum]